MAPSGKRTALDCRTALSNNVQFVSSEICLLIYPSRRSAAEKNATFYFLRPVFAPLPCAFYGLGKRSPYQFTYIMHTQCSGAMPVEFRCRHAVEKCNRDSLDGHIHVGVAVKKAASTPSDKIGFLLWPPVCLVHIAFLLPCESRKILLLASVFANCMAYIARNALSARDFRFALSALTSPLRLHFHFCHFFHFLFAYLAFIPWARYRKKFVLNKDLERIFVFETTTTKFAAIIPRFGTQSGVFGEQLSQDGILAAIFILSLISPLSLLFEHKYEHSQTSTEIYNGEVDK